MEPVARERCKLGIDVDLIHSAGEASGPPEALGAGPDNLKDGKNSTDHPGPEEDVNSPATGMRTVSQTDRGPQGTAEGIDTSIGQIMTDVTESERRADRVERLSENVNERRVKVVNLSDRVLSSDQLSLLSKGLGFVPVKKQRLTNLISELREWERLVRLREFWSSNSRAKDAANLKGTAGKGGNTPTEQDLCYKKSHWTPEKGRDPWLDMYIEEVTMSVLDGVSRTSDSNMSKREEKALTDLLNDSSIVIRPADKGSGVVVLNTKDYLERLQKVVDDSSTYRSTNTDQTQIIYRKVKSLADKLFRKGYIGKHLHKYLIPAHPKPGYLQGNPELHKEGHPLRAIVSGRGHATEGIAELAEKELNTHVMGQPSFVRDSTDFINKIKDVILPVSSGHDPLLFCMDVTKLYPSVPRTEGIAACKNALDLRLNPGIPTKEVIEMIELVLDNNNFSVGNSNHYVQIDGTAIGSKLGRNYACMYLGQWERELLNSTELKPFIYLRYVDDILAFGFTGRTL